MSLSRMNLSDALADSAERKVIWDLAITLTLCGKCRPSDSIDLAAQMRRQLQEVDLNPSTSTADSGSNHHDSSRPIQPEPPGEGLGEQPPSRLLELVLEELRLLRKQVVELSRPFGL